MKSFGTIDEIMRAAAARGRALSLVLLGAGLGCGMYWLLDGARSGMVAAHAASPSDTQIPAVPSRQEAGNVVVPEGSALRSELVVAPVAIQTVTRQLDLPAVVEADPARTAKVLPALGGHIVDLKVSLGDQVTQGQVLAVIDSADLAQAYDDDDKARSALEVADKALERQRGLTKIETGATKDLEAAEDADRQAASEYARTQARLRIIGAPADASPPKSLLVIKAPIGGTITDLEVAQGTYVNDPTQPLLTISQLDTVWVTANVPENDISFIAKDQPVDVKLMAYPDRVLHGTVLFRSEVLDPDTRRSQVRIAFANPDGALMPNMFATATFLAPPSSQLVIPTSALLINNDRTTVFVETAPWTFARRDIDTGYETEDSVVVIKGLSAGEHIVVAGGVLLND